MEIDKNGLKKNYNDACNAYLKAFAEKHGLDMSDCGWVAEEPGGIASIGDYFVDMPTIITDIDMEAPEEEFWKWYEYTAEVDLLELPDNCNYKAWLRGCPRYSEEAFERIRALRNKVDEAKRILKEAIEAESGSLDGVKNCI